MSNYQSTIIEQLQQLCMLIHHASSRSNDVHNPHRGQGRVLAILKLKPEISQKELTYLLGTSRQALAELLAKLEKAGFITRTPSPEDPRAKIVKLTEAGATAAEAIETPNSEAEEVFDCLSAEEQATLSTLLERLIKRYEADFPEINFEKQRQRMHQFRMQHNTEQATEYDHSLHQKIHRRFHTAHQHFHEVHETKKAPYADTNEDE